MNTRISYLYRDASNFKVANFAVIEGEMTQREQRTILNTLSEEEYFIPRQVGLPEKRFDTWTEDDHPWFELEPGFAAPCASAPTVQLTCAQLVANFVTAKDHWDDSVTL